MSCVLLLCEAGSSIWECVMGLATVRQQGSFYGLAFRDLKTPSETQKYKMQNAEL